MNSKISKQKSKIKLKYTQRSMQINDMTLRKYKKNFFSFAGPICSTGGDSKLSINYNQNQNS